MTQDRYNDGSQNPPRLRLHHSLWSLQGLPMNTSEEWTLSEKFERVKGAGFEAVECWLDESDEQHHRDTLNAAGLRLILGHHPHTLEDARRVVAQAKRLDADFVFAQPLTPWTPLPEAVVLLREAAQIARDHGLPFFVETHRGSIPESLNQALALIELMPEVRFTGDLSHFILTSEFYGWPEERAAERLDPVLRRVSHLHGRISSGEQIQIDAGNGTGEAAQFFVNLWARAMSYWREDAAAGDVFPFAAELGPPRYAQTLPDGTEFSDRWAQSLVMKKLAEKAWELSAA